MVQPIWALIRSATTTHEPMWSPESFKNGTMLSVPFFYEYSEWFFLEPWIFEMFGLMIIIFHFDKHI